MPTAQRARKVLTLDEQIAKYERLEVIARQRIDEQLAKEYAIYETERRSRFQFPWIQPPIETA